MRVGEIGLNNCLQVPERLSHERRIKFVLFDNREQSEGQKVVAEKRQIRIDGRNIFLTIRITQQQNALFQKWWY